MICTTCSAVKVTGARGGDGQSSPGGAGPTGPCRWLEQLRLLPDGGSRPTSRRASNARWHGVEVLRAGQCTVLDAGGHGDNQSCTAHQAILRSLLPHEVLHQALDPWGNLDDRWFRGWHLQLLELRKAVL